MPSLVIPLAAVVAAAPGSGVDIEAAVQAALARAPALAAQAKSEAVAAARTEAARSAYLPRLSFEASYLARAPVNNLPIELPALPGLEPIPNVDDVHHVQVGLTAGYRVLDLGRGHRVQAAQAAEQAEAATTEARRADLAFAVRGTFLAALYAQEVRDIASASVKLAQQQLRRAELRAQAGVSGDVAVAQARVRVASLQAQQRRAESELDRHRHRLASFLGQESLPSLAGSLESMGGPVEHGDLLAHPEVRRLAALERASVELATGRKRDFIPTLSVMGSAKLQYPRALKLELGPVYEAGISLAWPLFDGFLRASEVQVHEAQAEALARMSDAQLEALRRDIIDVQARENTVQAELQSAEQTLVQTQVYLRVARAALEAGAGTELDVHTAELGLDQAKMAKKKALFERALLGAEALRIHGRVLGGRS